MLWEKYFSESPINDVLPVLGIINTKNLQQRLVYTKKLKQNNLIYLLTYKYELFNCFSKYEAMQYMDELQQYCTARSSISKT